MQSLLGRTPAMFNLQCCGLVFAFLFVISESKINPFVARNNLTEDVNLTTSAVEIIQDVKTPLKTSKALGSGEEWIIGYHGDPFDISIFYILTLPLVMGKLAKLLCKQWRPIFSHADKQPQLPLIPLVILQASRAERDVKMQPRNGIQWFGETFLIHANADFIDIEDAAAQAAEIDAAGQKEIIEEQDDEAKTPWLLVRAFLPFYKWISDTKQRVKHLKAGKPLPPELESLQPEVEEELKATLRVTKAENICDIYDLEDWYDAYRPKGYFMDSNLDMDAEEEEMDREFKEEEGTILYLDDMDPLKLAEYNITYKDELDDDHEPDKVFSDLTEVTWE